MRFKLRKDDVRAGEAGTGGVTPLMTLNRMSGIHNGLYKSVCLHEARISVWFLTEKHMEQYLHHQRFY